MKPNKKDISKKDISLAKQMKPSCNKDREKLSIRSTLFREIYAN